MQPKILFIDDDKAILELLRVTFEDEPADLYFAEDSTSGLKIVREQRPNVAVIDIRLPGKSGLEILQEIKAINPEIVVIMTTGHNTTQNAIEAMKYGAYDFLLKPFDILNLIDIVNKGIEANQLSRNVQYRDAGSETSETSGDEDIMIGSSPEMIEIWKKVGQVAASDATVLIEGESGTGKELLARAVYNNSNRKNKPFLAVNCAALPESILESELFGHEKGAFTDAHTRRIGKFEQCDGGTLFLDEVSEMSLESQGKLLRVLENQKFERVGGNEPIQVDVRIIAATNRSLQNATKTGKFRLDLFYRLRIVTFQLPPLRDRQKDIPLLCDLFVREYARKYNKSVQGITTEALDFLQANWWDGNIRELKNAISAAIVFARDEWLKPEDFGLLKSSEESIDENADALSDLLKDLLRKPFAQMLQQHSGEIYERMNSELERALIELAMQKCEGNQVKAAKILGISRNTLRNRLERFGIT
ncbi:MAG: sigma-54-dependent Fis family transcriptional regulator [Desulfuromonas sp.]|nr:MAG: sigma-54-dependent Fis family transcriptional regulator [Desulfuromonas sp.]